MRRVFSVPALGAAMVVLTVGAAPLLALAADHLDAPNLGSIHVDPSDNLSVTKLKGPLDINDVYVFKGASANHTVLAMTVNPAVNLGIGPSTFEPGAAYTFNIDTNKNSRADREFKIVFGKPKSHGVQSYKVIYERDDMSASSRAAGPASPSGPAISARSPGSGRIRSSSTCLAFSAPSRARAHAGWTTASRPTSSWV